MVPFRKITFGRWDGVREVAGLEYAEGLRGPGGAAGAAHDRAAREQGVSLKRRRLAVVSSRNDVFV